MSEETQTSMASSSSHTMKSKNNAAPVTDPSPSPINVSGFSDILGEGR